MASGTKKGRKSESSGRSSSKVSKKEQIIALFTSGMGEVEDLALITGSRPSYVGSVLQEAGLVSGYFDLYTSSAHPMNVYSKFFANQLGFKDEEIARQSVEIIDRLHRQFEFAGDRAGQHHALAMALIMFDRARWTGKGREANIFREWLLNRLAEAEFIDEQDVDEEEQASSASAG
ncbi:MAG TPA: hypothetical protein VK619_05425 [Pyrinomonadaceae bacterium]|nr:hypothetical protein [Pyrinomonadaceae bacterium]